MLTKSPAALDPALLGRFIAIVGERNAVTDPQAQLPYLVEMRDMFTGHTPVVLRPGSVAEVSAILALADASATAIVPQGGNTGLCGGQTPQHGEIVLSLNRLDRIREVDPVSNTMTCEAGVTLQRAREAAAEVDRLYPQLLPSEGTCTIGGNLSTNAGGTAALAHGVARSHALGIEVVLADGRVLDNLNKLKKDNTGYDLKNLFIGAEGTLGVITAAVLRLVPRPRSVETAFVGVPSPQAALDLLGLATERTADGVTSFELMLRMGVDLVLQHGAGCRDPLPQAHPWYALIELSSQARSGLRDVLEEILATGLERGLLADAAIAESLEQAEDVLAHPGAVRRGAAPRRRLDQARRLGAGRRGSLLHRRRRRRRRRTDPGRAPPALRASRRRQHPLQRGAAARCRQGGVPGALGRGQRRGVRGGGEIRRLDLRRARHRRDQARPVAQGEGPGGVRADAHPQAHARPQGHPQSRQGAVAPRLVSRFRRSLHITARSSANVGSKGTLASLWC